jgi:hypothetical protein
VADDDGDALLGGERRVLRVDEERSLALCGTKGWRKRRGGVGTNGV